MIAGADTVMTIRPATTDDIPALELLIAASARAYGPGFYSAAETEAAITHVFGVDSDLIADGTYFVVEEEGGHLLGCGGWSRRRTLFGGDRFAARTPGLLDPGEDAARIRAFFVAPGLGRRGVGSALLQACEAAAIRAGFTRMMLMATLPGVPFYRAQGYQGDEAIAHQAGDTPLAFIPMSKDMLQK